METFIIRYETGMYDSHCLHQYAIDAESKEALTEEIARASVFAQEMKVKFKKEISLLDAKENWPYRNEKLKSIMDETGGHYPSLLVFDSAISEPEELKHVEIYTVGEFIDDLRSLQVR